MESAADLTGLAAVTLIALFGGLMMTRLGQPAIVGYILAGLFMGPGALGVVQSRELVETLAELGVLMLLFVIGMELSIRAFMVTWRLALSAVALQTAASLGVMLLVSQVFGFSAQQSVLFGFVVALSSTAVAIKMMEETREVSTRVGRITVAVLIAQDLAFLPMLLIVEGLGRSGFGFGAIVEIVVSVGLLAALMVYLNRRRRVDLPFANLFAGHADLAPLTGLVYCFGASALFGLIGLKAAYGAFLAGLIIGRSNQREQLMTSVRPIQAILVMVFFLSIGLLFDLGFIVDNFGAVVLLTLIVTVFKSALNIGIFRVLGETWRRAFLGGVLLSQIGEFSFLIAAAGFAAGAIDSEGSRLVVAVTVLSLISSPFWLAMARRVHDSVTPSDDTLGDVLHESFDDDAKAVRRRYFRSLIRLRGGARIVRGWFQPIPRPKTPTTQKAPDDEAGEKPPDGSATVPETPPEPPPESKPKPDA